MKLIYWSQKRTISTSDEFRPLQIILETPLQIILETDIRWQCPQEIGLGDLTSVGEGNETFLTRV